MLDFTYKRPSWTCGRYDGDTKSAIMYNLIAGFSFFFEDKSAEIVGHILSNKRGATLDTNQISELTNIAEESIIGFFKLLEPYGLVSRLPMTVNVITNYRNKVVSEKRTNSNTLFGNIAPNSEEPAKAEKDYASRTKKRMIDVMFELTYDCSEKCVHCYNPGAARNHTEKNNRHQFCSLSLEDYKRIIDECYEEGMIKMCLTGGDPFSNPFVWDIIKYLYEKDIAIEVFTNGQNLYGKEKLLASFFPCDVGVSVYSTDSSVHDSITQIHGSWNKTITVLSRLSDLGVPLEVKCCVMRPNVKSYYHVVDIAHKYNAFYQLQSSVFDSMDGDHCVSNNLLLTPEEMKVVLLDEHNPLYVGSKAQNYGKEDHSLNDVGCHAGVNTFCITPNGNVVLCSCFDASLGNAKEKSISEILDNPVLKKWLNLKLKSYVECGRYDYCSFCQICPGLNFAEHGTPLKASSNNCYVAKIRFKLAKAISSGVDPLNGNSVQDSLEELPDYVEHQLEREKGSSYYGKSLNIIG